MLKVFLCAKEYFVILIYRMETEEATEEPAVQITSDRAKPSVAFISGHIELTTATFLQHYQAPLDFAIAAGDHFIISNAKGADTLALRYLLDNAVSPARIKIYLHASRRGTQRPNIYQYKALDVATRIVWGSHTDHDSVMTKESDYDILLVRSEEGTREFYGSRFRRGRVSGTEKNRLRRQES